MRAPLFLLTVFASLLAQQLLAVEGAPALNAAVSAGASAATQFQCKLGDWETGLQLDLTSLSAKNALNNGLNWKTADASKQTYLLNVCDYLLSNATDTQNACGTDSFGCQLGGNGKSYKTGTHVYNAGIYYENIQSGITLLQYVQGTNCSNGVLRSTVISFVCDKNAPLLNGPSQVTEENHCEYQVLWNTPLACASPANPASDSGFATTFSASNGNYFDVSQLKKLVGNWVVTLQNATYVLNIGQPVNGLDYHPEVAPNCDSNAGGCHIWSDVDSVQGILDYHSRSIGKASTGRFYLDSYGNLNYNISDGSKYSPASPSCVGIARSTNIRFECASVIGVPTFLSEVNCAYYFLWATSAACPTSAPSSSSLNTASIIAILFFVGVFVYLFGGCMYKRHALNAKGWEQLPNYNLWSKCCDICSSRRSAMERTRVGDR